MTASLLVHWLTVTFAEVPPPEDFSSQLSSLRLDGTSSRVGSGRMGSGDLTLGELLVSAFWIQVIRALVCLRELYQDRIIFLHTLGNL